MIRINLLPAELRRGNRMPARVFTTMVVGASLTVCALGWLLLVWFGELAAAEARLADAEIRCSGLQKQVAYHAELERNKTEYGSRVQTIDEIAQSRKLWSKFCDELIDIVNNGGDTERHLAWFSNLSVKTDQKLGPSVTMNGLVQGEEKAKIANLHEDLEGASFAAEVSKSDPSFRRDVDNKRMPAESLAFPLTMQWKVPEKAKPPAQAPQPQTGK